MVTPAKLETIQRQSSQWQQEIVTKIEKDESLTQQSIPEPTIEALNTLHRDKQLHITKEQKEATAQLITDWSLNKKTTPAQKLIIVDTNHDVEEVNEKIQKQRIKDGELTPKQVRVGSLKIGKGDLIRFEKTNKTYNVAAGQTGIITHIHKVTKLATVKLDNGRSTLVNMRHYKNVTLGYAVTPNMAKQTEVNQAYVLTTGRGKENSLIQLTRARYSTNLYTWVENPQHLTKKGDKEVVNEKKVIRSLAVKMGYQFNNETSVQMENKLDSPPINQPQTQPTNQIEEITRRQSRR